MPISSGDTTIRRIIRSGVPLFDDWLAGVREGGAHLLTGGPGSGKSSITLHFAHAGLRRGEQVAMLVHAREDDVKAHAAHLGLDLNESLRDGRLLLLRYRQGFVHTAAHVASPEQVVADLDRMITPHHPARLIIDGFSPFIAGAAPAGPMIAALVAFLERSTATTLLTFPEDLRSGYDRSLEPLMQGAAAVIRLVSEDGGIRRAELVNLRHTPPGSTTTRFIIRERVGIVAEHVVRSGERQALRMP